MRIVLLLTFLFLCAASAQSRVLPTRDQILINELRTLGDSVLQATATSHLNSTLTVAQMIIDANVAQPSVIEGMRTFVAQWTPVLPRVTVGDYSKYSLEFPMIFGIEIMTKYQSENEGLDYFTRGAFSPMKAKFESDEKKRLTAFKDIAVLKMAEISEETKQSDDTMMNSFNDFVNQEQLFVPEFFTFLRALRRYNP